MINGTTNRRKLDAIEAAVGANNFKPMAEILRKFPELLDDELRELAASKFDGTFRPKVGRPASTKDFPDYILEIEIYECFLWLTEVEGYKIQSVNNELATLFGFGETKLKEYIRFMREFENTGVFLDGKKRDYQDFLKSHLGSIRIQIEIVKTHPDLRENLWDEIVDLGYYMDFAEFFSHDGKLLPKFDYIDSLKRAFTPDRLLVG